MSLSCRTTCWSASALAGAAVTAGLCLAKATALGPAVLLGILIFAVGGAIVTDMVCGLDATPRGPVAKPASARRGEAMGERRLPPRPAPFAAAQPRHSERTSAEPEDDDDLPPNTSPQPAAGLDAALARLHRPEAKAAPELLDAPRGGVADDLKEIRGIGPALEQLLNAAGVWHFDQIAAWRARDIAFIDERMTGFHGRIGRDRWVQQARDILQQRRAEDRP